MCTGKNGEHIDVSDSACKALWTGANYDNLCCGSGPSTATAALDALVMIRGLCVAALLSVIVGLLPIFLGGLAKMYGKEVCSIVSGTIGLVFQVRHQTGTAPPRGCRFY